jgi:cytochrome c2
MLVTACAGGQAVGTQVPLRIEPRGSEQAGRALLAAYGCGSCHIIPGVATADSTVGPPLNAWADRRYIAGAIANTPVNLVEWIRDPQAIEPGTAMPDLNVEEQDAWDMTAYLFSLRKDIGADGR